MQKAVFQVVQFVSRLTVLTAEVFAKDNLAEGVSLTVVPAIMVQIPVFQDVWDSYIQIAKRPTVANTRI